MFDHILVICDGNICRSPTAAFLLADRTHKQVSSAGIIGLEGHDMDKTARAVAAANGLNCPVHCARKLTRDMCRQADLLLVMETRQKDRVMALVPEASGKVMLLGHWINEEIPDPYKKSREVYEYAYALIEKAVTSWQTRLG